MSFVDTYEVKFQEGSKVTPSNFNEDFAGIIVWFIEMENEAMFLDCKGVIVNY